MVMMMRQNGNYLLIPNSKKTDELEKKGSEIHAGVTIPEIGTIKRPDDSLSPA